MRAIGEIHDSTGAVIGDGPLTTITSVTYKTTLDGIGQATVTLPATDRRTQYLAIRGRLTVKRPRVMRFTDYTTANLTAMFTESIIVKIGTSDTPGGAETTVQLVDKVALLEDANTLIGRKFKSVSLDSALTTLLGLSSGFTHSFVDAGLSTLNVHIRFDGVTVLQAIREVLAIHGLHWYAVGGTIYVTSGGNLANGVLFNMVNIPAEYAGDANHAVIQEIRREVDADGIVNRIYPLGKGDGNNALTLKKSTRSSPYTISSVTGPNGKTQYYIRDSTSESTYGVITRVLKFSEIAPADETKQAQIDAANQLYDAAAAHLAGYKDPVTRYSVLLRSPNTAYGSFGAPRPGEKRRMIYRGLVNMPSAAGMTFSTAFRYIDVDDEFWVTSCQESINLEGYSASVELSNVDVKSNSPAAQVASSIERGKAGTLLPAVDPRTVETIQTTDATVTTLWSYTPDTESTVLIDGYVGAQRDTQGSGLVARFAVTVTRNSGGTTNIRGTLLNVDEDSGSAPTVAFDVSGAAVRMRVTGVAAQTWDWLAIFTVTVV